MRAITMVICAMALFFPSRSILHAQVIGSSDNFDCFNDTDQEAEGFEIDVEDISPTDLTREFPSNFSTTPWVIRYGLPTVTSYDYTSSAPDAQHPYDKGHKGVLITWAATWNGSNWIAQYGFEPFGTTVAGDGTPYVANPTYTNGDSCWFYGLGDAYPTSGCDHFGISFAPTAKPGKIFYHWKIPSPTTVGQLINAAAETSLPISPVLSPVPGKNGVVHAVAQAPDDPVQALWGPAYFLKVTTLYSQVDANLDQLQKANVQQAQTVKTITYRVLQRAPAGQTAEKEDSENDKVSGNNVSVTKQYEYFVFNGSYDGETNEAVCDNAYHTKADAVSGKNPIQNGDSCTIPGPYWVLNSYTDLPVYVATNEGKYLGAHINAYNLK